MKKTLFLAAILLFSSLQVFGETEFSKAMLNCDSYSQDGAIPYNGQTFNLKITLQKSKGKCVYKEKIYQNIGYEQLTCNFDKDGMKYISNSMSEFADVYKKEIAKNKIFEAKLTSNADVFQKYLVEKKYCQISHFKKK